MSRYAQIESNSRAVLRSDANGLATTWHYRRLTSDPGVEPRTYTDWEEFAVLPTAGQHVEKFDQDRSTFSQASAQRVRCPDDEVVPPLEQGDQVKDDHDDVWAVMGVSSSGPGSVAYAVERDKGLMADGDRKGGV